VDLGERISGCLLAGAVGDALGSPVEFLSWAQIRARFGPAGVTRPFRPSEFTDDTQMTLFTVEGLIRARVRGRSKGICHPPSVVRHAYLRWLHTQGVPWAQASPGAGERTEPDGWLVREPILHRRMAPGNTCLSALRDGGKGTVTEPANDSKGCGAVMRAAPAGFFAETAGQAWETGREIAAITHGHPDGIDPAGVLAVTVRLLADGVPLAGAVRGAAEYAPGPGGTRKCVTAAIELAASGLPDPATLTGRLGHGWVGDEALAIAVCCVLAAPDPAAALLAAVNHSGDSDSTGAIAGNLLGASLGLAAVPQGWLDDLSGRELIGQVAADAAAELLNPPWDDEHDVPGWWWERYPGW
jgi:ADP-ribosylglycohydrolase